MPEVRRGSRSRKKLESEGYQVIRWDGRYVVRLILQFVHLYQYRRTTLLVTDEDDRIIVFGAGPPNAADWDAVVAQFLVDLDEAASKLKHPKRSDRRGNYHTIATGISYGGGQRVRFILYVAELHMLTTDNTATRQLTAQQTRPSCS